MTVYELKKDTIEIKYRDREKIKTFCTLDQSDTNPETIGRFNSLEAAKEAAKEYPPKCTKYTGYYIVAESYIEIYEADDNGEFLSGSDYDSIYVYSWDESAGTITINA